ncbi:MAG TPA: hypothetical protein ENK18_01050 [Deltaproteobacteria bacterium]|nr:hypothetical protein [Deltaproteobacteria bacterium]
MSALDWLDVLPTLPRRLLLGGTGLGLAIPTLWLDPLVPDPELHTAIALAVVGGLGLGWAGAWLGLARPVLAQQRLDAAASADARARDRGLLAKAATGRRGPALQGVAALSMDDPGFCLPASLDAIVALHTAASGAPIVGGPASLEAVRRQKDRIEVDVVAGYTEEGGGGRAVRLTASRPAGATSPPPDAQGAIPEGTWSLDRAVALDRLPAPSLKPDPGLAAARRALLLRAEAFDLDGFEALVAEINDVVDRADATTEALEAYTTPGGLRSVRWWHSSAELPQAGAGITWLEVEEDGWYERIEIRCGDRLLGLLRPSGQPEEPWRLWRLRGAS